MGPLSFLRHPDIRQSRGQPRPPSQATLCLLVSRKQQRGTIGDFHATAPGSTFLLPLHMVLEDVPEKSKLAPQ